MKELQIANISTFLPRECGIATFSNNLLKAIVSSNTNDAIKISTYVVALDKDTESYKYPKIVKRTIRQNHISDYIKAADFINYSKANLCILQHEFGIFGGESGTYILSLIHQLKTPFIVVFHTVLKEPTYTQKIIVQKLSSKASKIVVMSNLAIDFLQKIYDVPKEKIAKIEHGVPDFKFINDNYRKRLDFKGKKVLLTFGLINRNKGIETVLEALVEVVKKHKNIIYIILGKTHPNVIKESGEEYRNYLHHLVHKYSLGKYVYFYDHFVTDKELFDYISATDIYIVPYLNQAQMTSGPLSYAVGAGCTVLSTPFWHAKELLANKRGILFNFNDGHSLAEKLIYLIDNPDEMLAFRKRAYKYGRTLIWPETGNKYLNLIESILKKKENIFVAIEPPFNPMMIPAFSLKHVKRLTNDTGIIQHATYNIPNLKTGYCIDDNSRALLMTVMAWDILKDEEALNLIPTYLSFINYMQNENGTFKNFLSFNNQYLDEKGSEDSFGRTIWALGYLLHKPPNSGYYQLALELFLKAVPNFRNLKEIRSISYTVNGLCFYLKRNPSDEKMMILLQNLTTKIIERINAERDKDWIWFNDKLTYSNGIVPFALFKSYELLKDEKILKIAEKVLHFLEKIKFKNNYLEIIGNNGWLEKGKEPAYFAQQPVNATAMVFAFYQAYKITKKKNYLKRMFDSYLWFLGENRLSIPLYNFDTTGCSDGLENVGINKNQGAESTLSYLIAHLKVLRVLNIDTTP